MPPFRPLITHFHKHGLALEPRRATKFRLTTSRATVAATLTTLIAECLSMGSWRLRHVTLEQVTTSDPRIPVVIDCTVEDGGFLWRVALKHYLAPLRIIRGVDLNFDGLGKLGGQGVQQGHLIRESLRSREKAFSGEVGRASIAACLNRRFQDE
jgi:hypothetical protein